MRWAGIDEAGYGPNLGPLVMTAVLAEGPESRRPDVWADRSPGVSRAGGPPSALWVDDSKKLYRGRRGRDRLEAAALATLAAVSDSMEVRPTLGALLHGLGAGSLADVELDRWLSPGDDPPIPSPACRKFVAQTLKDRPLQGRGWRIVGIRSLVVGPARFNRLLETSENKAGAHFAIFAPLLRWLWEETSLNQPMDVRADKHGGRHFYLDPLTHALPDPEIIPQVEGPSRSAYIIRQTGRSLQLELIPRADADDGLVALASIVSKAVREWWMDAFNAFWLERLPGLTPTAGYPVDASRFRSAIEPVCQRLGLQPDLWWRRR